MHIEGLIVTASGPDWLKKFDRGLGLLIAIPTALLVLLEIFVLLGGVIARYAFHNPIIWSDELASTLFLWLAMLGSAIALHRAEHMRMTAFVGMLSPPKRLALDAVATVAALTFLLLILPSAHEFAMDEIAVTTPAMQISDAWRAAALPTGFAIMVLIGFVRLFEVGNWRDIAGATCASLVLVGGMYLLQPVFENFGNLNLLIFFVGIVACLVFAGVPIAFAFGLGDFRISSAYDANAHRRSGGAHRRRNVASDSTVRSAVCVLGSADRDDGNGAGDGWLLGKPSGACSRRSFLCADRRHVSGVGNLGLQGGRHGGDRTGAVSRDEGPWLETRRACGAVVCNRRPNRNHSSEPGADHGGFCNRRIHCGVVHRRTAAGARCRRDPLRRGLAAQPGRRFVACYESVERARSAAPSSLHCPPSPCRSSFAPP